MNRHPGRALTVRELSELLRTPRRDVENILAAGRVSPVESSRPGRRYDVLAIERVLKSSV